MYLKFLTLWIKHLASQTLREGCRLDLQGGDVMVVLFCKTFRQFWEMFLFRRERNEPMIVNQAKYFPSNYTNQVGHLLTALLQSIVNICLM